MALYASKEYPSDFLGEFEVRKAMADPTPLFRARNKIQLEQFGQNIARELALRHLTPHSVDEFLRQLLVLKTRPK
jgi:hypothetical protein